MISLSPQGELIRYRLSMISVEQISPQLTWRVRHDVLHPDKLIGEMELDEDAGGMHFGAFMENKLVGVV
jgi:hypothetical protein